MRFYSTNNPALRVDAETAVLRGLAEDGGLYMPEVIPQLPEEFFSKLPELSMSEIGLVIAREFFSLDIPESELRTIVESAMSFDAPLVKLSSNRYVLELFCGPTLAFKDFGARFMARLMSYYRRNESRELTVLVATSGDTGGAVASGFFQVPGIRVLILYPSGSVSPLQEKQLTTLGDNISALEVAGNFDDCQQMVKSAFIDHELLTLRDLTSANSINISRLIPQSFYYFRAVAQLSKTLGAAPDNLVVSVPSGNFGNLTAGIFAQKMGLSVAKFIAATNANKVVADYLRDGEFQPRASIPTISNAMDIGNPSNLARIRDLYSDDCDLIRQTMCAFSFSDEQTRKELAMVAKEDNYLLCPHTAVGHLALRAYQKQVANSCGVVFATAHPAKFVEVVEDAIGRDIELPEELSSLVGKEKVAIQIGNTYSELREYLLSSG